MSIAFLIGVSLATGFVIRLMRRWQMLMLAAALIGATTLAVFLAAASSDPIDFLGRTFTLDLSARLFIFPAIFATAALAIFATLTFDSADQSAFAIIRHSQGAFFFLSLAALTVVVSLDSFPLASFAWALGLVVLMFLAIPIRVEGVGGAAQFTLLVAIATASLLISNRFLELYPLTPENLDLVRNAVLFLAWGMGLLLAVVPLHIWLSSLGDELPLLGTAFLVGVAQAVGVWLILGRVSDLSWLVEKSAILQSLTTAGILTIPLGAVLALSEKREARWLAYLSLVPLGHALIGLGLGTKLALAGALIAMLNRALGVALVAGGLTLARARPDRMWQQVAAVAILIGGFSLASIPPTLGAVAALTIYRGLSVNLIALLFVSDALVFLATIRVAWQVLEPSMGAAESLDESHLIPYICTGILLILGIALIAFGIFPQGIVDNIQAAFGSAGYLK